MPRLVIVLVALGFGPALGCGSSKAPKDRPRTTYRGSPAPISLAADRGMVHVPAGGFLRGSTPEEREAAYLAYENTAGHAAARKGRWFERERAAHRLITDAYVFDLAPVTNAAYAEFVRDTGHRAPSMDEATWKRQGYAQDWKTEVARFVWPGSEPDPERAEHPVVLVSWDDAVSYCRWRGDLAGAQRRLPTSAEFERVARGPRGMTYPWGPHFDASMLNSAVAGPRDTMPVGSYPRAASHYKALDTAGNVFQWTRTRWPHGAASFTVKGSAWDDYGGLGRGAAEHGRPQRARHAIVGFRCSGPTPTKPDA